MRRIEIVMGTSQEGKFEFSNIIDWTLLKFFFLMVFYEKEELGALVEIEDSKKCMVFEKQTVYFRIKE